MSRFSPLALRLALPASLLSSAALADLTPADVWGDWHAYMESMGYQIDATENTSGDTLTVSDLNMSFAIPDEQGQMEMSLGRIDFAQNRDGTVAIILPGTMPITMSGKGGPSGNDDFTVTMNYVQSGHTMTASGTPDMMTYLYNAQTIALDMLQMQAGGQDIDKGDMRVSFSGSNLSSSTTMTIGDIRGYDQTGSIDSVAYDFFVKNPDSEAGQGAVKGTVNGVSLTGKGSIPMSLTTGSDMSQMLAAGFDVAGTISYAAGSSEFDIKDPENGDYVMNTSSKGGDFAVKMGPGGVAYDVSQRDLNVNVVAAAMPFPIEITMAESGFNLAMPVSKSEEVQDFALGITMGDFTMSDIIWSIFDPAAQLPRDPATILLDVTGKAKLLIDWMNPEAAAQMTGAPGEVKEVTLGNLLVSAAGAKLEGKGGVAFDGAAGGLVPGMGNPVGDVNFALAGGNGLLDKLVAMGLLPQDQAMGARMMMGLFAVAGDAPDTLNSKIEFTQDGQILANGQRIR